MIVILPMIPNPADVVLQGAVIGDYAIDTSYNPIVSMLDPVLQGAVIGNKVLGDPVPRAMIGQPENYGVPAQTGPKVFSGGELVMLDIGKGKPQKVYVNKTQEWLMSEVPQSNTGNMDLPVPILLGAIEPTSAVDDNFVAGISWFEEKPAMQIPRRAIKDSGIIKNWTAAKVSPNFCFRIPDRFNDTTQSWYITVTVKNETGVVVSGATVLLVKPEIQINTDQYGNPIINTNTTDANGQCVFQVAQNIPHQFIAYKTGAPYRAGMTVNTVPFEGSITMFIKDTTLVGTVAVPVVGNTGLVRAA